MRVKPVACLLLVLALAGLASAQEGQRPPRPALPVGSPPAPNSDPVYQQLRKLALGTEAITVSNVILKRDAGTFTFASGAICFLAPVEGKVTGAVFAGSGSFAYTPPNAVDRRHISILTGTGALNEEFDQLVLRFTDDTYEALKKAPGATVVTGACSASALDEVNGNLRKDLHYNVSGRILQDMLGGGSGGLFMAFVKGKKFSSKMIYAIDPHGAPQLLFDVSPEEVELLTWDDTKFGIWSASHLADEYTKGIATSAQQNAWIHIEKQDLDATFDKNGKLTGKAVTTFVSRTNGLRVVPFNLFSTLRVSSVTEAASGQQLGWIQEDKDQDADFFVILPKALPAGERYSIVTSYEGKDAVSNEGQGNYYVSSGARNSWYPNGRMGDYAMYEMRFGVPKGMTTIGTGTPLDTTEEGNLVITRWRSEQPQTVAGFQFGRFKQKVGKAGKLPFDVEAYANTELPDVIKDAQNTIQQAEDAHIVTGTTLETINTTSLLQKSLAEAQVAVPIYTDYFGPAPFKRLAVSQQTAGNYGQSWPGLVWLPFTYFFDTTQRHQLGMDDARGYFKAVAAHEIAHQWFGHTVTWGSYRDQWMSEGFSELAASLFVQAIQQKPQEFIQFWDDERDMLTVKNRFGFRAIDAGPLTMGIRLTTAKTGGNMYNYLVYPKGGYVLHMIRMMLRDLKTGDANFKAMMQDFIKTYAGRAATTEDFKAMVEKHMTPEMNLTGDGKMDWFFNEYVYGIALPHYKLEQSIANGELTFKITQSGVNDDFLMLIPLYLELKDGRIIKLGSANLAGNNSTEGKVPLGQIADATKRAVINYYDDVLAIVDK